MLNQLAENLRYLRTSKNHTQKEMDIAFQLSNSTWARYEKGYSLPNIYKMHGILNYFNVHLDELLHADLKSMHEEISKNLKEKNIHQSNQLINLANHPDDGSGVIVFNQIKDLKRYFGTHFNDN